MTVGATRPQVAVVLGSKSDLPIMQAAIALLEEQGLPVEVRVMSAHRTPRVVIEFASHAEDKGLKAIIAGAGGAAHLAGVIAALTALPVIGVPIKTRALAGKDSLYATAQMPPGVPVAAVGIDSAGDAARIVVEMLRETPQAAPGAGPGKPLATVAIHGGRNAGILATQLLAATNPALRSALAELRSRLARDVEESDVAVQTQYAKSQPLQKR